MLYCTTQKKNWETAQRLICHAELFSPKALRQWTFLCFNLASDTSQEYLRKFYCCRQYEIDIKSVLYNTQNFCIVNSDMQLNNAECIFVFPLQQWFARTRHIVTLYAHCLSCSKLTWLVIPPPLLWNMKVNSVFLTDVSSSRDSSLFQNVQTDSGLHHASC